uniref:Uncharacterized protein n=1 Tax=Oryza nivara TaxID=4536 RepID=A0A0E0GXQ3_ORYNI
MAEWAAAQIIFLPGPARLEGTEGLSCYCLRGKDPEEQDGELTHWLQEELPPCISYNVMEEVGTVFVVFDQAQGQLNPLRLPNGRQDLKYHGVQGLTDHRALRFRYKGYSNLFLHFWKKVAIVFEDGKASRSARDITA